MDKHNTLRYKLSSKLASVVSYCMQTGLIFWGFQNGSTIVFFPANVITAVNIYKQRCRKDQNKSK